MGCRPLPTLPLLPPVARLYIEFFMLNIFFGLSACLTEKGGVTQSQAHAGHCTYIRQHTSYKRRCIFCHVRYRLIYNAHIFSHILVSFKNATTSCHHVIFTMCTFMHEGHRTGRKACIIVHIQSLKTLWREDYQSMRVSAQMVTIMIGANDFCSHMCYLKNFSFTPQLHKDSLIKALDYLRDNMPRTIVNLVPPPREYVRNHTHSIQRNYISQLPQHKQDHHIHIMHQIPVKSK